jgi:hypothetical protein
VALGPTCRLSGSRQHCASALSASIRIQPSIKFRFSLLHASKQGGIQKTGQVRAPGEKAQHWGQGTAMQAAS